MIWSSFLCMENKCIGDRLKELGLSPSLLNWGDGVVGSTKIWFDEETQEMRADCVVSIPVDNSMDIAHILIGLEDAIIKYYRERGVILRHTYI